LLILYISYTNYVDEKNFLSVFVEKLPKD